MHKTHRHIFYKKSDQEIFEFIANKIQEQFYEQFHSIREIRFHGDFTKRSVIVEFNAHYPYWSGEN